MRRIDVETLDFLEKAGFAKIEGARRQARRNGFKWLWVDTKCIDKSSSAELSEAIKFYELLAPQDVHFYEPNWKRVGSRNNALVKQIEAITGIESNCLMEKIAVKNASIAKRIEEGMVYCMLGLFDINMPQLCGEGAKAFVRLQEEIIKVPTDHSLLCWQWQRWLRDNAPHPYIRSDPV
ncbi:hypothetical protein LY76DRAFT_629371 [Colletotrichum caudatum]|nr:hypothetical protein LY76DRAFT_629371 [Colletotrichum caudatum]